MPGVGSTKAPPGHQVILVDLVMTGQDPAIIKGTAGECLFHVGADGTLDVSYTFLGSDYPSLGSNGLFSVNPTGPIVAGQYVQYWISGRFGTGEPFFSSQSSLAQSRGTGEGITVSADHKLVTITNAPLSNNTVSMPYSGFTEITDRVSGTISCS
jgi:hypothetical protein